MKSHALFFSLLIACAADASAQVAPPESDEAVRTLVPWLFKQEHELQNIAFADVLKAATGKQIIPFDPKDADDFRIAKQISAAMDSVLEQMNADEKVKAIRRINEVSSHFENLMRKTLNAAPDFSCDFPR